jgi:serine/threonine-protein kinase PknG
VLAYGIEILPALGYLHGRGLLFCDFKPDNVIHAEEQLKLIDLGAVRRVDDQTSPLWGTPGYQAPELEQSGASVASDLYTVGRTLAVLSFDFGGFSTRYAHSLPHPGDVELLAREESFHRLLLRATHTDPARRFASAGDFAEQALGVLREVLSAADGVPRPATSTHFTSERRAFGGDATAAGGAVLTGSALAVALPLPLVDPVDPAAGVLATIGAGDAAGTVAALRALLADPAMATVEVRLRLVRALVEAGEPAAAGVELALAPTDPGDWRTDWYAGLVALAGDRLGDAVAAFDAVCTALPGEVAARLALAATSELAGDADGAIRRYLRVWRVDRSLVSAAFGLARTLLAVGDPSGAVAILDEVPEASSQYLAAQVAAVRASLAGGALTAEDLVAASGRLERLRLDAGRRAALAVELLRRALHWLTNPPAPAGASAAGLSTSDDLPPRAPWPQVIRDYLASFSRTPASSAGTAAPVAPPAVAAGPAPAAVPSSRAPEHSTVEDAVVVLGGALREEELRLGLERAYRVLASLEPDPAARRALVDQANAVRPRTVL